MSSVYSLGKEYYVFGYHYNYAVVSDPRGICPSGWHVPTRKEFQELIDYLGGPEEAWRALILTGTEPEEVWYWYDERDRESAHGSSGWAAMPNGMIIEDRYARKGTRGIWWVADSDEAIMYMESTGPPVYFESEAWKSSGLCIRCIMD